MLTEQELRIRLALSGTKYSEDQPRDDHGRFGSGGGDTSTVVQSAVDKTIAEMGPPHPFAAQQLERIRGMSDTEATHAALTLWRGSFIHSSNMRAISMGNDPAPAMERDYYMRAMTHVLEGAVRDAEHIDTWRSMPSRGLNVGDTYEQGLMAVALNRSGAQEYSQSDVFGQQDLYRVVGAPTVKMTDLDQPSPEGVTAGRFRVEEGNVLRWEGFGDRAKSLKYSEDQPRDDHGRFGSGGGTTVEDKPTGDVTTKPVGATEPNGDPLRTADYRVERIYDNAYAEAERRLDVEDKARGFVAGIPHSSGSIEGEIKATIATGIGAKLEDRYQNDPAFKAQVDGFMRSEYNHERDYSHIGGWKPGAALPFVLTGVSEIDLKGGLHREDDGTDRRVGGARTMDEAFRIAAGDKAMYNPDNAERYGIRVPQALQYNPETNERPLGNTLTTAAAREIADREITSDDGRRFMFSTMADNMVYAWAGSSSDTSVTSTMTQEAVGRMLGNTESVQEMESGQRAYIEHDNSVSGLHASYDDFHAAVADGTERFGFMYDAMVRQVYDDTQAMFAANGTKEVTAWRGFALEATDVTHDFSLATIPASEMISNPVSSWSWDSDVANRFANYHSATGIGYVFGASVPVQNIWSTALTGPGCHREGEMILFPPTDGDVHVQDAVR